MNAACLLVLALFQQAQVAPADDGLPPRTEIAERLAEVTSEEPQDDTGESLAAAYRAALDALDQAAAWTEKADGFEEDAREAPARIAAIREELAREPDAAVVPEGLSLTELEQGTATARASLEAARQAAAELEAEAARRSERRVALPELLAAAQTALGSVEADLQVSPPDGPPELAEARRFALLARARRLAAEIRSHELEIQSIDVRRDLLSARRNKAARAVGIAERQATAWQTAADEVRAREAERLRAQAEETAEEAVELPEPLAARARESVELAAERERLVEDIQALGVARAAAEARLERLEARFADTQRKLDVAGLTEAIGRLLRQQRLDLSVERRTLRTSSTRKEEIAEVQLRLIELEDRRASLVDLDVQVRELLALAPAMDAEAAAALRARAREILAAEQAFVDALIDDYRSYFTDLVTLDTVERQTLDLSERFLLFINERVLWVRSTSPLWQTPYAGFVESVVVLVDPRSWIPVLRTAWDDVRARTELYVLAALGLLALLVTQRVARRRLVVLGERAARASQLSIAPTLVATALTLLAALPWPMLLVFVGSRLDAPDAPTFARSVAQGLLHAAPTLYILHVLRLVVRRQGVGESHFRFREASVKLLRRNVWWLTVVAVPAEAVVHALSPLDGVTWGEPLARLAFLVQMGAVATFLHRVLHPRHGVLRPDPRSRRAVLPRLRGLWFACGVLGPAALGVLALLGYFFTARHLSLQLELSSGYVLLLVIVQGIALRWVLLTRRRLAIEQLREKRAADHEKDPDSDPVAERAAALEALDVAALSHEVHQLTRMLIGIAAVVGLWFVWVDFVPALGIFREIPLWDSAQRVTRAITDATGAETEETVDQVVVTSLADLLLCLLILFGVVVANKNLPALLEISLLQRLPLLQGERYAITTLTRYAITIVGIVMAFERIGIGWSKVQWLAAGISVGLGFGLQEIFANFVSGLTLLFERPIRVGDWVTVGGIEGHVTRIRMRATTIVDRDLKELIVPNREFVTAQFINWTLSDPVTRVVVPVGVAYGSDVELTETTLHEVGRECPYSVKDPSPNVVFLGFGPSSLDFELRVFVTGRDILPRVTHDLHKRIDAAFRRAKIEIAFPQRDLHLRSAEPLVEALRARSAAKD